MERDEQTHRVGGCPGSMDIRATLFGSAGFFGLLHPRLFPNLAPLPITAQPPPFLLTVPGTGLQALSGAPSSPYTSEPPIQGASQLQPPEARPHLDLLHPPSQAADPGAEILLLQAPRVRQDFRHERGHGYEAYPRPTRSLQRPAPQLLSRRWPHRIACRETEPYGGRPSRTGDSRTTVPSRPRAVWSPMFQQLLGVPKVRRRDPLRFWFSNVCRFPPVFSFCILVLFCLHQKYGMFHIVNPLWPCLYLVTFCCEII